MQTILRALLFMSLCSPLPELAAQADSTPDSRVRVTQANGSRTIGGLISRDATEIRLAVPGAGSERVIPMAHVAMLERSLGQQRRLPGSFLLAMAGTALIGGIIASSTWDGADGGAFTSDTRGHAFRQGLLLGGLAGIPVGVVVGLTVKQERWEPLQLSVTLAGW